MRSTRRTLSLCTDQAYSKALAAKYSTEESPVSLTQFLAWNPYIQGTCDRVNHIQRVCKGLV